MVGFTAISASSLGLLKQQVVRYWGRHTITPTHISQTQPPATPSHSSKFIPNQGQTHFSFLFCPSSITLFFYLFFEEKKLSLVPNTSKRILTCEIWGGSTGRKSIIEVATCYFISRGKTENEEKVKMKKLSGKVAHYFKPSLIQLITIFCLCCTHTVLFCSVCNYMCCRC